MPVISVEPPGWIEKSSESMVDVFGVPWSALVEYVSTLSVDVEERRRESMMGTGAMGRPAVGVGGSKLGAGELTPAVLSFPASVPLEQLST